MSKTSSDPTHAGLARHVLNGPTMGTRWQATFHAAAGLDPAPLRAALQAAVDEVDAQMSTWKPDSALMRLNRAPLGEWLAIPPRLAEVLRLGLAIGRASDGAFDIGMGDAVGAWGFGPAPADPQAIRAAMTAPRQPAHEVLDLDGLLVRKRAAVLLDFNGIAKGYGVDRLIETLREHGVDAALTGIDGEMRATGLRPDGSPWTVAVEAPDPERRTAHSIIELQDAAVATSGDYRHRVVVQGRTLSHSMDPRSGAPLAAPPASATVIARTCAEADAWATALIVAGHEEGMKLAHAQDLGALLLLRSDTDRIYAHGSGPVFGSVSTHEPTMRPSVGS